MPAVLLINTGVSTNNTPITIKTKVICLGTPNHNNPIIPITTRKVPNKLNTFLLKKKAVIPKLIGKNIKINRANTNNTIQVTCAFLLFTISSFKLVKPQ